MRLKRNFYLRSAEKSARDFLGKILVHKTDLGRVAGVINEVEAYPAFIDEVHHGNKRTARTEIIWGRGGFAYVYLIYGAWHQFGAVVNREGVPDLVLIRGAILTEGRKIVEKNWRGRLKEKAADYTNGPGKLCKSFQIDLREYGADLVSGKLFIEDGGANISDKKIRRLPRVGINSKHKGYDLPLRYLAEADSLGQDL